MNKKQHIKTIDQLIHDDAFILWCLFPTEKLEQVWIDDYLTLYPEERENIEKAKQMVRLLKLNNSKLSSFEKDSLKKNITRDLEKRRKSRQIRLIWQYAAACILIVCTLGSLYLINKENVFQGGEALSLVDEIPPQKRFAPGKKLRIGKGLRQIIVSSRRETHGFIGILGAGCQKQDRHHGFFADLRTGGETGAAGHHHIQYH